MKATDKTGKLIPLSDCYITSDLEGANLYSASGSGLVMDNLPDISDGKTANYTAETGIGRSAPYKNYAYSEERAISMDVHMFVQSESGGQSPDLVARCVPRCRCPVPLPSCLCEPHECL